MRIAVTGATGFVGAHVARSLLERGDHVVALTRRAAPELAAIGATVRPVDLPTIDPGAVEDVDAVVHAAATAGPDLDTARQVNRDGTRALVGAATTARVSRFVHVSTTSVYDRDAAGSDVLAEDAPLVSADAGAPTVTSSGSAYAVTKAEAEREVEQGIASGLTAAILRPPAVLGPGPTSTWGTKVPRRVRDGEPVPGPRASTFGFVAVEDLAAAILAAVDRPVLEVVNVVGGHVEVGDYLDAVAALFGDEVVPQPAEGEPWQGRYDTSRLGRALEVTPLVGFADAMAAIAASWAEGDPSRASDGSGT
ncbi:MAG: NAD(P)-dependent oxidoreductase [Nitriliruptoraceae bacterium]|nr:NAD(P)-dependent oxidoreductase [Nitriliruptoraceae bacterium]